VSGFLSDAVPRGIISGPSFAKEVAIGLPTAITVASPDQDFVRFLGEAFHSTTFRPYLSDDLAGVEVGGAIKNVLAVAAGISDGMRLGANARAGLITRGLAEMTRLGVALGGRQETFQGLSGLGDLVLTCTDDQSRNRRLGLMLGKGASLSEALQTINQTVEGIRTAKEVFMLAGSMGVEMPICEQVYRVLHEDQKAHQALTDLLRRPIKNEALF
jgi:glycerol-3-phosphate dehydrogenase (NAD(P)+)